MKNRLEYFNDEGKRVGYLSLKNEAERADIRFYGTIVSNAWRDDGDEKSPRMVSDFLSELDENAPVDVYINSGGGSVYGGIAIANILSRHKGETTAYIDGLCASIAVPLAMSCDRVVALKGTQIMVHKPWTYAMGDAVDLEKTIEVLNQAEESILDILMDKAQPTLTRQQLQEMLAKETWITGKELPEYFVAEYDDGKEAYAMVRPELLDKLQNVPEKVAFVEIDDGEEQGENNPVEGEGNPEKGDETPVEGDKTPVEGEDNAENDVENSTDEVQNTTSNAMTDAEWLDLALQIEL